MEFLFHKSRYLILISALTIIAPVHSANSQTARILKETRFHGWNVSKVKTPTDGVRCQAFKCETKACNVDNAAAVIRFWGSQKRGAVTPMIGMRVTRSGAKKATLSVSNQEYLLAQSEKSRGKLFIAKKASDDAKIMRTIARKPNGTVVFRSEKGSAQFRLRGIAQVVEFFERECGIPKP